MLNAYYAPGTWHGVYDFHFIDGVVAAQRGEATWSSPNYKIGELRSEPRFVCLQSFPTLVCGHLRGEKRQSAPKNSLRPYNQRAAWWIPAERSNYVLYFLFEKVGRYLLQYSLEILADPVFFFFSFGERDCTSGERERISRRLCA